MDAPTHQAMYHVPTLMERIWRRLGYQYHLGEEPDGIEALPGWQATETHMRFGIADRFRLLLTGRLHLRLIQHMPCQPEFTKNRLDWQIKAPGDR